MQARWSTGLYPWSEAVEVEDLSAQIVHLWVWVVGLMGTAGDVVMMVTLVCVGERMGWERMGWESLRLKCPEEPGE